MTLFMPKPPLPRSSLTYQYGGATLMFVLIMLLVVSIIGVSAARSTLMQERMSSNTNIRNVVFEAAESALAEGEAFIANNEKIWKDVSNKTFTDQCKDGVCKPSSGEPRWIGENFWKVSDNFKETDEPVIQRNQEGAPIEITPKYSIEDLGQTLGACDPNHIDVTRSPDCPYLSSQRFFRVVGFAEKYNTQVTLQSTYLDPRTTRSEFEPIDLTQPPKQYCGDNKEFIPGLSQCCPDGKGGTMFVDNTDPCNAMCNGKVLGSNETCCPKGTEYFAQPGNECPAYCGTNKEKYFPSEARCCPDANKVERVRPGSGACPEYCDGQEYTDATKECCTNSITKKESLHDKGTCQEFCGNDQIGFTAYKPGDNSCCDHKTPFNNQQDKCCPDANSIKQVIPKNGNANCPSYCSGQLYESWKNQGCCDGKIYDTTTHGCCNNKLFDKKTNFCCERAGLIARRNIDECCWDKGKNQHTVTLIGACPDYCNGGNIPVKQGEECCGPTPYVKGAPNECCNGEFYNPAQNKCCSNAANNRLVILPGPENGQCPAYCMGQELQAGMECCKDPWGKEVAIKPGGTCSKFCWNNSNNILNYGEEGPCKAVGGGLIN